MGGVRVFCLIIWNIKICRGKLVCFDHLLFHPWHFILDINILFWLSNDCFNQVLFVYKESWNNLIKFTTTYLIFVFLYRFLLSRPWNCDKREHFMLYEIIILMCLHIIHLVWKSGQGSLNIQWVMRVLIVIWCHSVTNSLIFLSS